MPCFDNLDIPFRLPTNQTRTSLIADKKRGFAIDCVLFRPVYFDSGVIGGRPESMTLAKIRSVNIRSRVHNKRRSIRRNFDAERVVVSVRAASLYSAVRRIEQ